MKKKILFYSILILMVIGVSIIIVEIFSVLLIKKLGWNYEPAYLRIIKGYTSANLVGGRTEYHSWGSWNIPNYEGRIANNCFDVKYKFNSYGARDKERTKEGKNRTLVFGDSFIEGWGVPQDKILAATLEQITGKEFLNFGVAGSGTGPLNEYVLYKDFANAYEHDNVIVGHYLGNDFLDNDPAAWGGSAKIYYRPFWELTPAKNDINIIYHAEKIEGKYLPGLEPENKSTHFKVYDHMTEFSAALNLVTVLKNYKISLSKDNKQKFAYNLDVSDDTIAANLIIFSKFAKAIGEKDKYIIIIPSATDVLNYIKAGKNKIQKLEEYKANLMSQGWQVIDTMDAFAEISENEIPNYFICDGHWNDKGNRLAAEYIAKIVNK